jgi:hypothetical protein
MGGTSGYCLASSASSSLQSRGAAFLGPEAGRLKKLMQEQGETAPEVGTRLSRIFLVSRIELVVLLLVVADMALKPGS